MSITPEIRCALDDLVGGYALAVDRRDLVGVAGLFTPDGELVLPDPPDRLDPVTAHRGRAEIVAAMSTLTTVARTLHLLGGQVYRPGPAPGTVTGWVAGTAHHLVVSDDRATDLVWRLRYLDTYRLHEGVWSIARRAVEIQWIETHPVRSMRPVDDRSGPPGVA